MKTLTLCLALIAMSCTSSFGQTYKVLWSFAGSPTDGTYPLSNLISDGNGNLFGTTYGGGTGANGGGGTVFELSPHSDGTWSESLLYSFLGSCNGGACTDGFFPVAGLTFDNAGNLYGTTSNGGSAGSCGEGPCGTVFQLSPSSGGSWTESILYNFCVNINCPDGEEPKSQLVFDQSGNLYGTTFTGGSRRYGTVFELSPSSGSWTETVLYNFCANGTGRICPDGSAPAAGLVFDKSGNLYGTTTLGGVTTFEGSGTVYKLSPGSSGWAESTILGLGYHSYLSTPMGTVSFDPSGKLYTTALYGGVGGGVLQLNLKNQTQRTFKFNFSDGSSPAAGVIVDIQSRAIYGTTGGGGGANGSGTVYKIDESGHETVLYAFCQQANCADGEEPLGSLYIDGAGNLYGTTKLGGAHGLGTVFEITP